ncbi:GGDEF domain-containing protein [Fibrobacter sp. UBA3629]|uniref:GGDEF domain-containing protein n=1 Tax=Fibrobacter sp. UBA3629 TaxID=1946530 RepID=UPI0025C19104|nr:GGDEF domain-containing protein [Fibrobacter sp. UBA3629]
MDSVLFAIEVDVICILVLLLIRQGNREAASLLLCARALDRLLDFFIVFAALEIAGKILSPEFVIACRIIECLKIIACLAIAAAWFYMVSYAVTSSSYRLQKWALLILAPIFITGGYAIIVAFMHLHDTGTALNPVLWILLNLVSVGYLLGASAVALRNSFKCKNRFLRRHYNQLAIIVFVPLAGMAIQTQSMEMPITSPALMLTILFIYLSDLKENSSTDLTTGLNSTSKFATYLSRITQTLDASKRLFLIQIHIDDLVTIRKTHGKHAPDMALRQMAQFLRSQCKDKNLFLARYSSDTFAIVYECGNFSEVEELCNGIVRKSTQNSQLGQIPWPLSFSIYWSEYGTKSTQNIDSFLDNAKENCFKPPTAKT